MNQGTCSVSGRFGVLLILLACAHGAVAYDPSHDNFYPKRSIYVTWVMIWNGSTETHWWKPSNYHGCKVKVNGSWQSINWNSKEHIETYCESMRAAGVNAIVVDLTNGFRWEWQSRYVQQFCHDHGMKFLVAFNPDSGTRMEEGCKTIWTTYAAPDTPFADSYLYKDEKPVVVLYTTRNGYARSIALEGAWRSKFTTVWASGEDSDKDKWGWQLEPQVGPVPSTGAMFVTSSIKFQSPNTKERQWRKHLSWLDYGFALAAGSNPRYLIVGAFDDISERNAWMEADTSDAPKGMQMRDRSGAISQDAYYRRVSQWLRGSPHTVEGGLLPDGAYLVKCANGNVLGVLQEPRENTPVILKSDRGSIEDFIWFYHLGHNVYRLIKLNAGLPLEPTDSAVVLNSDSEAQTQRWILEKNDRGFYILNKASGKALAYSGANVVTEPRDDASVSQYWSLEAKAVVPR